MTQDEGLRAVELQRMARRVIAAREAHDQRETELVLEMAMRLGISPEGIRAGINKLAKGEIL